MNLPSVFGNVVGPIGSFLKTIFLFLLFMLILLVSAYFLSFFICGKINPFRVTYRRLLRAKFNFKYHDLFRWFLVDFCRRKRTMLEFKEFGFTYFLGRQGTGKTVSMVDYLKRMKEKYPKCIVVSNFKCAYSDYRMTDWRDLLEIRNGIDGVIFAIDEISSEYSSAAWKDFPESLLSEISQQRKQRVKIVATAQVFGRVVKPLREQAETVVICKTWFNRFTTNACYDALDYADFYESVTGREKLKSKYHYRFVQSDSLRKSYDTYEKVERMKKIQFIPRSERG